MQCKDISITSMQWINNLLFSNTNTHIPFIRRQKPLRFSSFTKHVYKCIHLNCQSTAIIFSQSTAKHQKGLYVLRRNWNALIKSKPLCKRHYYWLAVILPSSKSNAGQSLIWKMTLITLFWSVQYRKYPWGSTRSVTGVTVVQSYKNTRQSYQGHHSTMFIFMTVNIMNTNDCTRETWVDEKN